MATIYLYPILVKEAYLDFYGHVNNAMYMTLFEEARWDCLTKKEYGLLRIKETGIGPVILEATLKYRKELKLRDQIVIETEFKPFERKIARIEQRMMRDGELCTTAEFVYGLFDVKERKLVLPTPEWIQIAES